MTIFLILAPYGAFAFLMLVTSSAASLLAAAAICFAIIVLDLARGHSVKILGAGSVVTFATVGSYVWFVDPSLSVSAVKLSVDAGVLLVVLLSIAIRRPFTLQYALEEVGAEIARLPGFVYANYVITWAWAAAMLAMTIGNVALIYMPSLPIWSSLLVAFAARNSAVYFTKWYPEHRKAKYGTTPVDACPACTDPTTHRKHDDERRTSPARLRLPLHHRIPGDLSRHRQRHPCHHGGNHRRNRPGDLVSHQG
jgi:hypothetical protein